MKKIHRYNFLLLFFAFIFCFALRTVYLDRIPLGVGQDELDYKLSAKSLMLSGTDLLGRENLKSIFSFHYPQTDSPKAELSYLFQYLSNDSLFGIRVVFALLSSLSCLVIYGIGKYFFSEKVGIIASLIYAINPWEVFIGRTSFEVGVAVFFFLLIFYILLIYNGKKILFTLPLIVLAFYAYIATKAILLPYLILICAFLYYLEKRKANRYLYLGTITFTSLLLVVFIFTIHSQPQTRTNDIFTPFSPVVSQSVDEIRHKMFASGFNSLFINKYTIYIEMIMNKFAETMSLPYLFLHGDYFISFFRHGLFYVADALFLVIGGFMLIKKHKKISLLFLGLVLIGIAPHLIHKGIGNFTPHIALAIPFAILIIAYGINQFVEISRNKKISILFIIVIYGLLFMRFINFYFMTYPIVSQNFDFPTRVLARYINLSNNKVTVYSSNPEDAFKKIIFYSKLLDIDHLREIKTAFAEGNYRVGKLSIVSCGGSKAEGIMVYDEICREAQGKVANLRIGELSDSGGKYAILNDKLCVNSDIKPYLEHKSSTDLAVESMSSQIFCNSLVMR